MTRTFDLPYGAYELKSCYQRNMLWGTFSTIMLTAAIIGSLWIYGAYRAEPEPIVDGGGGGFRDSTIIKIFRDRPRTDVDPPRPVGPPQPRPPRNPEHGIIIIDPYSSEQETGIMPPGEYPESGLLNPEANSMPGGRVGGTGPDFNPETYVPPMDTFIAYEMGPEFVQEEIPEYPEIARESGFSGVVYLQVYIGTDGRVVKAVVVHCTRPNMGFEEAALDAARKCLYRPAIQNGYPVAVWMGYAIKFVLQNSRY